MSGIRVEIELDDGRFISRMWHAGESVEQFNRNVLKSVPGLEKLRQASNQTSESMERAGRSSDLAFKGIERAKSSSSTFLQTARDTVVVVGLLNQAFQNLHSWTTGVAGNIIGVNAEFERLNFLMRGLAQSSDPIKEAANNVNFIRDTAAKAPFSLQALQDVFVKMKATGIDPVNGSMTAFVDALAAMGGTDEQLKRVGLAVTQMSGKGVIQMEELRQQLGEALPTAAAFMARSMGVSIGELFKAIETGTVQAQPALKMLQEELDRVYGGAAIRMMQSFTGQINLLRTNWQNFAIAVGNAGFFEAVKTQLQDLNALMSSPMGARLASEIGTALTSIIGGIRSAINFVIEWRSQIVAIGQAFLTIFVGSRIVSGIAGLITSFGALKASILLAVTRLQLMNSSFVASALAAGSFGTVTTRNTALLAANTAAISANTAATGANAAAQVAATATGVAAGARLGGALASLVAIAGGITGIGLALGAIGSAIYVAGNWFGWFEDKAQSAFDTLKKFGAESQEQINLSKGLMSERENTIKALEDRARIAARRIAQSPSNIGADIGLSSAEREANKERRYQQELERIRKEWGLVEQWKALEEEKETLSQKESEFRVNQGKLDAQEIARQADVSIAAAQQAYNQAAIASNKKYEEDLKRLKESGKSQEDVRKEFNERNIALRTALYNQEIAALEKYLQEYIEKYAAGMSDPMIAARVGEATKEISDKILKVYELRDALMAANPSIPMLPKLENNAQTEERLGKAITNLSGDIAKARAELNGFAPEVAELNELIEGGKFGNAEGSTKIRKLIEELKQLQGEYANLKNVLEDKRRFDRDLESANRRAIEERVELETQGLNDMAKLRKLVEMGYYGKNTRLSEDGMTVIFESAEAAARGFNAEASKPEPKNAVEEFKQSLEESKTSLNSNTTASKDLGTSIQNTFETLGSTLVVDFNGKLNETIEKFRELKGIIDGVNLNSPGEGAFNFYSGNGNIRQEMANIDPAEIAKTYSQSVTSAGNAFRAVLSQFRGGDANVAGLSDEFSKRLVAALQSMPAELRKAITINSGYRSVEEQAALRRGYLSGNGRTAAPPGRSQHNFGNAVDIGFGSAAAKEAWKQAAAKNGLMMQYGWDGHWGPQGDDGRPWKIGDPLGSLNVDANITPNIQQVSAAMGTLSQATKTAESNTTKFTTSMEELFKNQNAAADSRLSAEIRKISDGAKESDEVFKNLGKSVASYRQAIREGKFGTDTNPESERYKELIRLAQEAENRENALERARAARKKAETATGKIGDITKDMTARAEETAQLLKNPLATVASRAEMALRNQLRIYLDEIKAAYGEGSKEFNDATKQAQQSLDAFRASERNKTQAASAEKTAEIQRSLMTESQARSSSMTEEIARLDQLLEYHRRNGSLTVELTRQIEAQKAAIRAQYAAKGPLGQQMQQWADLGGQMEQAMVGWLDGAADALAEFLVTGKANFKQLFQSIAKDIIKIGLRYMFSQMFGGGGKGGKGGRVAGMAMGGKAGKGGKALTPFFHGGGILGGRATFSRYVNPAVFTGAPRYHTGGILGIKGLRSNEVPFIGKKGEGVFTPEQMSAMAQGGAGLGMQQVNLTSNVTVNANGGTPEQNEDLSKQVAKRTEESLRGLVADELNRQMRPGGIIYARAGKR